MPNSKSALLTLDSVAAATPDGQPLFDGLTLAIGRERIGLVGRNGSGKSTLLRIIAGDTEPAKGSVLRAGLIGALKQMADETLSVAEALGIAGDLARLRLLERGEGADVDRAAADWTLELRVQAALAQTGLPDLELGRRLASLSGGERTRVALARVLIESPDVLLLDEPTNNLDTDGRAALAHLLENWRGGAIVASHDRALLERMDRVVELTPIGATIFGGAWSEFAQARDAARVRADEDLDRAARGLKRIERDAQQAKERQDRRDKAGRAKRANGDAPKILLDAKQQRAEKTAARGGNLADRMIGAGAQELENARAKVEVLIPLSIALPKSDLPSGRELLMCKNIAIARGGRHLFGPLSFELRGPERIAIKGANGAGKTTLLRIISGDLQPDSGEIRRLSSRVAMLDQHVGLLNPSQSVLDNMRRLNFDLSENEARAALARFAFRNQAALKLAGTLSGGERLRAGLACMFARPHPPELLILDEPTNHLDLAAIEELERALINYDGALIVVSHDQAFLDAIGVSRTMSL